MGRPRVVGSFVKKLPLTLLIAMLVWLAIRPVLDTGVTGLTEILIRAFEYPRVTRLEAVDHRARVFRSDFRSDSKIPTIPLTEIHFNTIVLLALFLALPKRFSRKNLERLAMAWFLLYLAQTLNLFLHVKCIYALNLGDWSQQTYSNFSRNFYGFWRYFTDLPGRFSFPFVFWLAFFWEEALGMLNTNPASNKAAKKRA
ncbi:MAG: hypothetical protein DRJ65_12320 [Acidobacteria bacterium]|nr:MAG: hypothetical protein DRJ65_12320 [Acidobacteriota bacterium]